MKTEKIPMAGRKFIHYVINKDGKVTGCEHAWGRNLKRLKSGFTETVICKKYGMKFVGVT